MWYNEAEKGGEHVQEIYKRASELIDTYKEQLAAKGIKIALSKKYVEIDVEEGSVGYNAGSAIFNIIEHAYRRKKEKANGYNFEENKYHSLVMTVIPLEKRLVNIEDCREYAFVVKKTERAHLGQEPEKKTYQEAQVLAKIEKRIRQILKKADKQTAQQICKNTFWDACRYSHSIKYEYKTRFCRKTRYDWDTIFVLSALGIAIAIIAITWAITKLV